MNESRAQDKIIRVLSSPVVTVVSLTCVALLLILSLYGLTVGNGTYNPERAGTAAEWFSGTVSSFAILLAWLSLLLSRRVADEERVRHDPVEKDRRAAGSVYFWLTQATALDGHLQLEWSVIFHNDTPIPVYEWILVEGSTIVLSTHDGESPLVPGRTAISLPPSFANDSDELLLEFVAWNGERMKRELRGRLLRLDGADEIEIAQEGGK